MSNTSNGKDGVDFSKGVPIASIPDGQSVAGKLQDDRILLVRQGGEFFAVGAHCTHYGGELAEGLIVGDTVRCPLHHACFSLRTGEPLRAPALDSVGCWKVERVNDTIFIREKLDLGSGKRAAKHPASVVIVGGGAAGLAAADMLRRDGYEGTLTMVSADSSAPCDRPNLSKDYLAGTASEDWIPLRPSDYYAQQKIDLLLNAEVASIDPKNKQVHLADGKKLAFEALLLATGAEPVRLNVEGAANSPIYYLRSLADSNAIIAKAENAKSAVVIGASFIGLEVAASLRERGIDVRVVAPEQEPLERVMGKEVGSAIRKLHESHGVQFHLGATVKGMDGKRLTLSDGTTLEADFVVAGIGVRPVVKLAEAAGLKMDRGVSVNEYLETSVPGIFAAGDIARWPDPHSGKPIRVEHWVVAERQGQTAAKNILGQRVKFDAVPFFWSRHYDKEIHYVGHAEEWDSVQIDGDLNAWDWSVSYRAGNKTLAAATVSRDRLNLEYEHSMEIGAL
jgi:NADPH-dependent 2,4-dienoyl-CoA reductase/sulfur reductase-like enzyme/nitrite reductase/ring-hydroxylating ferredoxin subunit